MKILHLNDHIPDKRVEKGIQSGLRMGCNVELLIVNKSDYTIPNVKIHFLQLSMRKALFQMNSFKKIIKEKIMEIDPDVIHAHNILFAKAVDDIGIPFIYDAHEYWKMQERYTHPFATPWTRLYLNKKIVWPYRYYKFSKWEKEVLEKGVTITPHEEIAKEYSKITKNCFVIPNQPEKNEVINVWDKAGNVDRDYDAIYIGADMLLKSDPFRESHNSYKIIKKQRIRLLIVGSKQIFESDNVSSIGYVPHQTLYDYTVNAKTGLIPWKPHPYHRFVSPNKTYLYFHSGCIPIIPKDMNLPNEKFVFKFKRISEIPDLINKAIKQKIDPACIIEHAKQNYLWEFHEHKIKKAYETARSL